MSLSSKMHGIPFRCVALATIVAACTSDKQPDAAPPAPTGPTADASFRPGQDGAPTGTAGAPGTGGISGGAGTSGGVEPPTMVFLDGSTSSRADGAAVCAATAYQAEGRKLDLLVLMDGSGSMNDEVDGTRKWDLVVTALDAFVNDPDSAGIGVGLTYFGFPAGRDEAGDLVVSCNVSDYARPAVPMADLPGNAPPVVTSLSAYAPEGGTPTRPALEGALAYADTWFASHPTHRVNIVLATDGEPNDCESTVDAVSEVAADGAAKIPPIQTYVIGVGASLTNLDQVATAGGTAHAYIVDTTQDTTARFIEAMNAIRGRAALPCAYEIPKATDGGVVDPKRVNVTFAMSADGGSGQGALVLQVQGKDACDTTDGGWYYDNPDAPASIELCPVTCERAKAELTGRIEVLVGCKTETAARPH